MTRPAARVLRLDRERAELEIAKELAERSGLKPGEELYGFAPGGNFLLLAREPGKRGFFVGSLETLSLAEVFGFVCSAIRSGTLVLQSPTARRRIVFREGQVSFAASSEPAERLGQVLWRHEMVDREVLQSCEPRVDAANKLGKLLVEAAAVTPAQLYRGVQLQVREIVLASFLETRGEFAFIEGDGPALDAVKLPERTRDLVLEGMGRAEEASLLRARFDLKAPARRRPGASPPEGRVPLAIWERSDGARSAAEVVQASRVGEWNGLNALAALVREGQLEPLPAGTPPARAPAGAPKGAAGPLQTYRMAIRRICEELRAAGVEGRLHSFFSTPEGAQGIFEDVHLSEQGDLDVEALLANAQRLWQGPIARARALEALDAFVSFALFDARNVLDRDDGVALGREVARMLRGK